MKKALVIGCTGQDGSLISKSLLNNGFDVFGTSRNPKNTINNHLSLKISNNIRLEELDICNTEAIEKLIHKIAPIEIYHLAAESSVGISFNTPITSFDSICKSSASLLEASKQLNFDGKLFFAGSSEIFGNTTYKATLNHTLNPKSPYAIAKTASMQMVKLYRELYNLKAVTGVLFNHESHLRDDKFVTKKIIKGAIQSKKDKNFKLEVGNIDIERDWGLAEEFVEAMQMQLRSEKICDQVICTGEKTSLKNFIKQTFNLLELNWKDHVFINPKFFRPQEIKCSIGDPTKMKKDTGWKANCKIDELIQILLDKEMMK